MNILDLQVYVGFFTRSDCLWWCLCEQCIGATTLDEHRKHIEKDKALARRFQPVMVLEPSQVQSCVSRSSITP